MSTSSVAVAAEAVLRRARCRRRATGDGPRRRAQGRDRPRDRGGPRLRDGRSSRSCAARFPDHDIVTEETDLARTGSRYVWFIDPLDGTTNFAHGYPFFCCVGGADPGRRRRWRARSTTASRRSCSPPSAAAGAHLNGRRLHVTRAQRAAAQPARHRLPLRPARRPHGQAARCSTGSWARRARSAATARPPSTSATWPRAASTASGRSGCSRGT